MGTKKILFKDLVPGQEYHVQIRAHGNGTTLLNSSWSEIFSFTPAAATGVVPNAPTSVTALVSGANFHFSWVKPTQNTDATTLEDFKTFEVLIFPTATPSDSVTFYTEDEAVVVTYDENEAFWGGEKDLTVEVKAMNSRNILSASGTDNVANPAPGAFTLSSSDYNVGALFTWTEPSGGDIDFYEVFRNAVSYATVKSRAFVDIQDEGVSRNYFVRAHDKFGQTTDSNTVAVTIESVNDLYVNTSGDTMTGTLAISGANLNLTGGDIVFENKWNIVLEVDNTLTFNYIG